MKKLETGFGLKKQPLKILLFQYTIFFSILAVYMYYIFGVNDKSMLRAGDSISQHLPALYYIRTYIREFLTELFQNHRVVLPMVDFRIGQGLDVLTTLNYYGFGDPLTLLTVLAPERYLEEFYAFMIFLRMYLSGALFIWYCAYLKRGENWLVILGAAAYAFCGFALYGGVKHPFFLNGMMYLPLFLLGVEKVFRERKYLFFSTTVFLGLISNFYFAYMNTVTTGIYIIIRLLWMNNVKWKERIGWIAKFTAAYLCGTGMAAVIFVPVIAAFLNNGRLGIGETVWKELFTYTRERYARYLSNIIFPAKALGYWTCLGYAVVSIPAVLLLFVHRGSREEKKYLYPLRTGVIVLVVMAGIPLIGKVMNGFSYVSNRWFYAGAFFVSFIIVYMIPMLLEASKKEKWIVTGISGLWICYAIMCKSDLDGNDKIIILCLILVLCLIVLQPGEKIRTVYNIRYVLLFGLSFISIALNIRGLFLPEYDSYINEFVSRGASVNRIVGTPAKGMDAIEDDEFYRLGQTNLTHNQSLINGRYEHNFYYSIVPSSLTEFYMSLSMNSLKYSDKFRGHSGRTRLDEISATKYYGVPEAKTAIAPYGYAAVSENEENTILENQYFLPLGFTYSSYITREEYDALETEEREPVLMECAVLEESMPDIEKEELTDTKKLISEKSVKVKNTENAYYKKGVLKAKKQGLTLDLKFKTEPGCETYLYLKGIQPRNEDDRSLEVVTDTKKEDVLFVGTKSHLNFGQTDFLINLGYSDEARTGCQIYFLDKMTVKIDEIKVICYSMENYPAQAEKLRECTLQNTKMEANRITGEITVPDNRLLYMSVPYSSGWSAYVDGEEKEVLKANLAYMAVPLTPGTHQIEFRYCTPWIKTGAVISILTFGGVIIYWYRDKKRRKTGCMSE